MSCGDDRLHPIHFYLSYESDDTGAVMADDAYEEAYDDWVEAETDEQRLGYRLKVELSTNDAWDLTRIDDEEYEELGEYAAAHDLSDADMTHIAKRLFDDYRETMQEIEETRGPNYGHLVSHLVAEGHTVEISGQATTYGDTEEVPDRDPDVIEADWPTEIRQYYDEGGESGAIEKTWFSLPAFREDSDFAELQHVTPAVTAQTAEDAIEEYVEEGGVHRPRLGVRPPRSPDEL